MDVTKEILEETSRSVMSEMKEEDLLAALNQLEVVDIGELSLIAWRVI